MAIDIFNLDTKDDYLQEQAAEWSYTDIWFLALFAILLPPVAAMVFLDYWWHRHDR